MKLICMLSILITLCSICSAQIDTKGSGEKCHISNARNDIVYIGIDNPLEILTCNISCDSFDIQVTNGVVNRQNTPCLFNLSHLSEGSCEVRLAKRSTGEIVGSKVYYAEYLPDPEIFFCQKTSGIIPRTLAKAQEALSIRLEKFGLNTQCSLQSFMIGVIRNKRLENVVSNSEARFNSESIKLLGLLRGGDKLIIYDAIAKDGFGRILNLRPAMFTIGE